MPYNSEHKEQSRNRILASAFELFAHQGYDRITINSVMQHAGLTRGAFYNHFSSKQELYREAMQYAALNSKLIALTNRELPSATILITLIEGYLSRTHLQDERPCPTAFLVTDMANREPEVRTAYTQIFNGIVQKMSALMNSQQNRTHKRSQSQALAALLIGGVAVSRALNDDQLVNQVMSACRNLAIHMIEEPQTKPYTTHKSRSLKSPLSS